MADSNDLGTPVPVDDDRITPIPTTNLEEGTENAELGTEVPVEIAIVDENVDPNANTLQITTAPRANIAPVIESENVQFHTRCGTRIPAIPRELEGYNSDSQGSRPRMPNSRHNSFPSDLQRIENLLTRLIQGGPPNDRTMAPRSSQRVPL